MGFEHGTNYGYKTAHCRCEACREWWNAWHRAYRKRRMERTGTRLVRGKYVKPEAPGVSGAEHRPDPAGQETGNAPPAVTAAGGA